MSGNSSQSTATKAGVATRGGPRKKAASSGPVVQGAIYAQDDFLLRTRWSVHALKTARRNGLRTTIQGNIAFISGDDFFEWMKSQAAKQGQAMAGN